MIKKISFGHTYNSLVNFLYENYNFNISASALKKRFKSINDKHIAVKTMRII